MTPDLSVVIPTYGRPECLKRALEGLVRQTGSDLRYEVLVVDDEVAMRESLAAWLRPTMRTSAPSARMPSTLAWGTSSDMQITARMPLSTE